MSEQAKALLGSSQTEQMLGIRPNDMASVQQHVHRLAISGIGRLYPQAYIEQLRPEMMRRLMGQRPSETAKIFSRGETATQAIANAEKELHAAITAKFVERRSDGLKTTERGIAIADLAVILCLERPENIGFLINTGSLTIFEQDRSSYIGETALRVAVWWERPQYFSNDPAELIADIVRFTEESPAQ